MLVGWGSAVRWVGGAQTGVRRAGWGGALGPPPAVVRHTRWVGGWGGGGGGGGGGSGKEDQGKEDGPRGRTRTITWPNKWPCLVLERGWTLTLGTLW